MLSLQRLIAPIKLSAARKILHAYREYTKRCPLVKLDVTDAHVEVQQVLIEYLQDHQIMRARYSPQVEQFLFYIQYQQWQKAFSMPGFLDYAITLFMYNKLHKLDFYNIIDVWQCLRAFTGVVFMQHQLAKPFPEEYFIRLIERVLPRKTIFFNLQQHLLNDEFIHTRYLYLKYQGEYGGDAYLLYSYRNALIASLPFPAVYQPYLLGNISINKIEAYCRGQNLPILTMYVLQV